MLESPGNEVAGVAFQALVGADNIGRSNLTLMVTLLGYIIPAPIIRHFLSQHEREKQYKGFPQMVSPLLAVKTDIIGYSLATAVKPFNAQSVSS